MSAITIRHREPGDDERWVEIRNAIAADRAPTTVEEHRHFIDTMPQRAVYGAVVAERGGELVGHASWSRRIQSQEEDAFWAEIMVDREHWGTGIGRTLYDFTLDRLRELKAKKVFGVVREDLPDAEAFATRRGFNRTGHGDRISRLDVRKANLEKSRQAAKRVAASGIIIASLDEMGSTGELLQALSKLDAETAGDIPGEEEYVEPPFDEWRTMMLDGPGLSPETFWVAMDGDQPVGLAVVRRGSGGYAGNGYTAVARSYRGQGIARALKLRTVEWARDQGVLAIETGNDPANKPMLAINVDLGYEFLPADIQLVKEL